MSIGSLELSGLLKIAVMQAGNTPAELAKEKKIEIWRFLDDVANGESTNRTAENARAH